MKALLAISIGCLAIVGVAASVGLLVALHSNRDLRTGSQKLEKELRAAQKTLDASHAENQQMAKQLEEAKDTSQSLQARISEMEAAETKDPEPPKARPVVAPYQVPAYLGQTYLGQAWIVPRNFRMDTNLQRYVYEPVVVLDKRFRNSFVVQHTNVVEREIPVDYVNYTYYPQPVYYVSSPGYRHHRGPNHLPSAPRPPFPMPRSPMGGVQTAPPFDPGSGVTTPQRLGTSAGSIKTRPQVLGTPAPVVR